MCLGTFSVQLQRSSARRVRTIQIGFAAVPVHIEKRAAVGDAGVRPGEVRIDFDGAIEHAPRVLPGRAAKVIKELTTAEVILVGLDTLGGRLLNCALLLFSENNP